MDDDVIDISQADPFFAREIAAEPGGENIRRCFACGTCTASCPVREVTDRYDPRRIIHMALLGLRDRVLSSDFIWLCSTCYACQERCPQDVRITELMYAIKNIAVREGYVHPSFRTQVELLTAHGRLYDITDFENERRQEQGLPPIHESAGDFGRIFAATGLDVLVQGPREGLREGDQD
ncbi:MAG: 4Fe-4S dicluster domain-containing protein [Anaerolineae bacterium]|nr:4Fe-4S dicluster domain-containing protein [Anaerolineae bacterium]